MLHFLLNLCAFCRLASRLAWDRRPCPAPAPAPARTAPARPAGETASRHGTRAARPAPCRRRARHAQRPGQMDTPPPAAPMPPACPPRSNRQSQQENARTSREEESERRQGERERGRKSEDLRPLACRIAAQVIKASNPARSQPDRSQRRRPAGTPPATVTSSSPVSTSARRQFCFWRVCRTPARFRPSADEQRHPRPPARTPPAPGEPSHFRARSVSHETAQYLHSITYAPYPHFSLGNNLDDSPTVNELNPYLQNHIFGLTTPVFLSTLYNSPRLQSYSSPIATKKTNILIDFRPQIW